MFGYNYVLSNTYDDSAEYHVYLVPNANVRKEEQVSKSTFVDLGRLRAFKGSQRYPVPAGVSLKDYPSVVIWCEQFSVLISPADLKPVAVAR